MRQSLKELFQSSMNFEYTLPNSCKDIQKSDISTSDDFCYSSIGDKEVSDLIYNGIVDLAFEDYKIDLNNLNETQKKALNYKIRFANIETDEARLKLGFYGEVLLNLFLQLEFGTECFVARGQFFDPLSNFEAHGYDSHHILERNGRIELWFGESKFYSSASAALTSLWKSLQTTLSMEYLDKNFQSIIQKNKEIETKNELMNKFIDECKKDPDRNFYHDIINYNMKLVRPILIVSNQVNDYDNTVKSIIRAISEKNKENPIVLPKEVDCSLFFIILPVNNARVIKKEVLECIQKNEPLI
ncbi:MAG: DUF1837 domain-containing protein [Clostridia bacterium]|nr:DUF1837 domain-containing protein [Clostridia bacterium]